MAYDFDNDGDLDLFVGARSVSLAYGAIPESHVYINNGKGIFTDMPADKLSGINSIGTVTGAVMADIDGDNKKDLVITGEWMAPHVFTYRNGQFAPLKTDLDKYSGWWQTVTTADVNNDGKPDLILGNFGENFSLKADASHPLKLWYGDFDDNGRMDEIFTKTIEGTDKPVFMKRELQDELPSLKKQNLRHAVYATKTIQDLFTPEQLSKGVVKQVNYSSSIVALNQGNGHFIIQPLPVMSQLSSIASIVAVDINNDGYPDLLTGGNEFEFQPQLCRLDANPGFVLINDGKGGFKVLDTEASGIRLNGMVRDIVPLATKSGTNFLFLQNNEVPVLYHLRGQAPPTKK